MFCSIPDSIKIKTSRRRREIEVQRAAFSPYLSSLDPYRGTLQGILGRWSYDGPGRAYHFKPEKLLDPVPSKVDGVIGRWEYREPRTYAFVANVLPSFDEQSDHVSRVKEMEKRKADDSWPNAVSTFYLFLMFCNIIFYLLKDHSFFSILQGTKKLPKSNHLLPKSSAKYDQDDQSDASSREDDELQMTVRCQSDWSYVI